MADGGEDETTVDGETPHEHIERVKKDVEDPAATSDKGKDKQAVEMVPSPWIARRRHR